LPARWPWSCSSSQPWRPGRCRRHRSASGWSRCPCASTRRPRPRPPSRSTSAREGRCAPPPAAGLPRGRRGGRPQVQGEPRPATAAAQGRGGREPPPRGRRPTAGCQRPQRQPDAARRPLVTALPLAGPTSASRRRGRRPKKIARRHARRADGRMRRFPVQGRWPRCSSAGEDHALRVRQLLAVAAALGERHGPQSRGGDLAATVGAHPVLAVLEPPECALDPLQGT